MSTILWKRALVPPPDEAAGEAAWEIYEGAVRVPRARRVPLADQDLVALPDPRAYRSLSRAGLLLAAVGLQAREALGPFLADDPYRVGVYCAMEWGPNDLNSARQMVDTPPEEFAATYKALRSAKQYFKMLPNVPSAQLAIFLGIMGPMVVYNHSTLGALHALEQAELDLHAGLVTAAVVCSAFSLEDPLLALRVHRAAPGPALCEAAACLVLVPSGALTDWRAGRRAAAERTCGIATDLVELALRSEPMISEQELYGHVESAIRTVLNTDGLTISPATSLANDLGAESIDLLDISCELEKLVDVEVNFRALARGLAGRAESGAPDITVEDIVEYLRSHAASAEAGGGPA